MVWREQCRSKAASFDKSYPSSLPAFPHGQDNPGASGSEECLPSCVRMFDLSNEVPTLRHVPEVGVQKIQYIFPLDGFINKLHHFLVDEHGAPVGQADTLVSGEGC